MAALGSNLVRVHEVRMAAMGRRVPRGSWGHKMAMGPEGRRDRLAAWGRLGSKDQLADEGPCLGMAGMEPMGPEGYEESSLGMDREAGEEHRVPRVHVAGGEHRMGKVPEEHMAVKVPWGQLESMAALVSKEHGLDMGSEVL